jgi:hypothetical protein
MSDRARLAFDFSAFRDPRPSDVPAPGPSALAVSTALLHALKERSVPSEGERGSLLMDTQGTCGGIGAIAPRTGRLTTFAANSIGSRRSNL